MDGVCGLLAGGAGRGLVGVAGLSAVDGGSDECHKFGGREETLLFVVFVEGVVRGDAGLEEEGVFLAGHCVISIFCEKVGETV